MVLSCPFHFSFSFVLSLRPFSISFDSSSSNCPKTTFLKSSNSLLFVLHGHDVRFIGSFFLPSSDLVSLVESLLKRTVFGMLNQGSHSFFSFLFEGEVTAEDSVARHLTHSVFRTR